MSSPSGPPPTGSGDGDALPPLSARHVSDAAVTDALIVAVRAATPDSVPSQDALRVAALEYVDAARARGETHERTLAAVRSIVTTIVTSAGWSGANRSAAREIIRDVAARATERFYAEASLRDGQPSTSFHFEVRGDGVTPSPVRRRDWDDGTTGG